MAHDRHSRRYLAEVNYSLEHSQFLVSKVAELLVVDDDVVGLPVCRKVAVLSLLKPAVDRLVIVDNKFVYFTAIEWIIHPNNFTVVLELSIVKLDFLCVDVRLRV